MVEEQKTIDLLLESNGIRLQYDTAKSAKGNIVKIIHKRARE